MKLCITPDQFVQNIIPPEKDEMWRHLLQKNFQNRIVRDPSRLAKCQTRRNNGTKSIQASKEMSSYNFQGTFKCSITLLCSNRNPSNNAMNQGETNILKAQKKCRATVFKENSNVTSLYCVLKEIHPMQ